MERWVGRVALVTGASSGIGKEIARSLVRHGMKVVGCSRNTDAVKELAESLKAEKGSLTPIACDVSKEEQVLRMFDQIKSKFGGTDVCINSAGLSHDAPLLSGKTEEWRHMFEVNVLGLCICSREALKSMKERSVDDGHVIQLNSGVGHQQYSSNPSGHFYSATKFAVTSLAEGLRKELRLSNSHIRVTSISPGLVETNFSHRMYAHDPQKAIQKYSQIEVQSMGNSECAGRLLCNQCGRTYASKKTFNAHEKKHSGSAPYRCCGKMFGIEPTFTDIEFKTRGHSGWSHLRFECTKTCSD